MANDEQPAHGNSAPASCGSCPQDGPYVCWSGCPGRTDGAFRPSRQARRFRDDRRIAKPPSDGWDHLPELQADSLSWPAVRLN